MNRRYKNKTILFKNNVLYYLEDNLKELIIISLIFFIGIIVGIILINNSSDIQKEEIAAYINSFTSNINEIGISNSFLMLLNSIKYNIIFVLLLWFMGTTLIGIPIIYLSMCFKGFCLGYTISSIVLTIGAGKGLIFVLCSLLLQNLVLIPGVFLISISGMKLYKKIFENKIRSSLKSEILRHTAILIIAIILAILSSLIEIFVSKNLLLFFLKYL